MKLINTFQALVLLAATLAPIQPKAETMVFPFTTQSSVKAAVTPVIDPYQNVTFRKAFFDAARIYGKSGCGDMKLAEMTAENSIRNQVPANMIAAIVSVESSCNPLAISGKGAVGLTQINVKVQASAYDFAQVNLFNPEQNMDTGTKIMASMIKTYGRSWVSHYDGIGPDADAYALKVQVLAGK